MVGVRVKNRLGLISVVKRGFFREIRSTNGIETLTRQGFGTFSSLFPRPRKRAKGIWLRLFCNLAHKAFLSLSLCRKDLSFFVIEKSLPAVPVQWGHLRRTTGPRFLIRTPAGLM